MDSSEAQTSGSPQLPRKPPHVHASLPSDRLDMDTNYLDPSWSTITPKKLSNHPHRPKRRQHLARDKLPEQYDMLLRLFNGLDSALRLLRLRKSVPFFTKIRATVEGITGRRFAHRHLAQMKYLMPEQVLIKRVSLVDEVTGCMKRDLHVTLIRSVIKNNKKRKRKTDHRHCVKKLFRSQLLKFLEGHPEGTDIPEEVLPAPFNKQMLDPVVNTNEASTSVCTKVSPSYVHQDRPQAAACHVSQSFRRHFSKMSSDNKTGNFSSNLMEADDPLPPIQTQDSSPSKKSPISPPDTKSSLPESSTPLIAVTERTPMKLSSTCPAKLMVNTPTLQPPTRSCSLTPDVDSTTVMAKSVNRPSAARKLKFDCPEKNAHVELELLDDVESTDILEILPLSIVQSLKENEKKTEEQALRRRILLDDVESTDILEILPQSIVQSLKENEKKTEEQALRRRILNSLPKLFDRIYYLFQSIKYSSIRKEALLHRLTTCHCDIVDESEVEEQLKLLQEVLPDWISQKLSPNSNVLLSIDKSMDPSMLRAKLQEAT